MSIAIYNQVKAAYRRDRQAAVKVVVVLKGNVEHVAETRWSRNYVQRRVEGGEWSRLYAGEVVRLVEQEEV